MQVYAPLSLAQRRAYHAGTVLVPDCNARRSQKHQDTASERTRPGT